MLTLRSRDTLRSPVMAAPNINALIFDKLTTLTGKTEFMSQQVQELDIIVKAAIDMIGKLAAKIDTQSQQIVALQAAQANGSPSSEDQALLSSGKTALDEAIALGNSKL